MSVDRDLRKLANELKRVGSPGAGALYEVSIEHFGPEHPTAQMPFRQLMSLCEAITETSWEGLGEADAEARR